MRSIRTYQREIARLKQLVAEMQWVQPTSNANPSCACCGHMKHWGCSDGCDAARISGDHGNPGGLVISQKTGVLR